MMRGAKHERIVARLTQRQVEELISSAHLICAARRMVDPAVICEPRELLNEAVVRVLSGAKAWSEDIPFADHMRDVMKSLVRELPSAA